MSTNTDSRTVVAGAAGAGADRSQLIANLEQWLRDAIGQLQPDDTLRGVGRPRVSPLSDQRPGDLQAPGHGRRPPLKQQNEGVALGYVAARVLESTVIVVGIVSLLSVVTLMYRSGLMPRAMAVFGLVGGPLLFASALAMLFGLYEQISVWGFITALPVAVREATLAFWPINKGFNPSATASESAKVVTNEMLLSAA